MYQRRGFALRSAISQLAIHYNDEPRSLPATVGVFYGVEITADTTAADLHDFLRLDLGLPTGYNWEQEIVKNVDGSFTVNYPSGWARPSSSQLSLLPQTTVVYTIGQAVTALAQFNPNTPINSKASGAGAYFSVYRPVLFPTTPTWQQLMAKGNATYVRVDELDFAVDPTQQG